MDETEEARQRCVRMLQRIEEIPAHSHLPAPCKRTLMKLVNSELNFLSRHLSSCISGPRYQSHPAKPLSINLGNLEATLYLLQQPFVAGVSRVCQSIPVSSSIRSGSKSASSRRSVHVDVACILDRKPVWAIVSDRNPKHISWHGDRHHKGLKSRIQRVVAASQSSKNTKPSSIILFFARGTEDYISQKLEDEFSASELKMEFTFSDLAFCEELEDGWINILAIPYHKSRVFEIELGCGASEGLFFSRAPLKFHKNSAEANLNCTFHDLIAGITASSSVIEEGVDLASPSSHVGDDDLVNFDTTAMVAAVSGISNGDAQELLATSEIELKKQFKGNLEFVIAQARSEIQSPIHPELARAVWGKRGIICARVVSEFKQLIALCGGPQEKLRAETILKCLLVVSDRPSDRLVGLSSTRKITAKNKVVFGTGDSWRAATLTANAAFVRAILQTGMPLSTILHRPRALTGA